MSRQDNILRSQGPTERDVVDVIAATLPYADQTTPPVIGHVDLVGGPDDVGLLSLSEGLVIATDDGSLFLVSVVRMGTTPNVGTLDA